MPVRAVAEMLDCNVDWDGAAQTAVISKPNGAEVKITIGNNTLTVDGKPSVMDTAAVIKDDRTYIPVRFVAEALGLMVEWK